MNTFMVMLMQISSNLENSQRLEQGSKGSRFSYVHSACYRAMPLADSLLKNSLSALLLLTKLARYMLLTTFLFSINMSHSVKHALLGMINSVSTIMLSLLYREELNDIQYHLLVRMTPVLMLCQVFLSSPTSGTMHIF